MTGASVLHRVRCNGTWTMIGQLVKYLSQRKP
jgi:hypothetical protein